MREVHLVPNMLTNSRRLSRFLGILATATVATCNQQNSAKKSESNTCINRTSDQAIRIHHTPPPVPYYRPKRLILRRDSPSLARVLSNRVGILHAPSSSCKDGCYDRAFVRALASSGLFNVPFVGQLVEPGGTDTTRGFSLK